MIGEVLPLGALTGEVMAGLGLFGAALTPIPVGYKVGWKAGSQGRSLPLTCLTAWGVAAIISGLVLLATVALIILPIGKPLINPADVLLRVGWVSLLIALIPAIASAFITYYFAAQRRAREAVSDCAQFTS